MFWWLFGKKRVSQLEEKTESAFSAVKKDIEGVSKWIKHLHSRDKEVLEVLNGLRDELSTVRAELEELRDGGQTGVWTGKEKVAYKKLPVLDKQTGVQAVQNAVQTAVQTASFYGYLKGLTANERLLILSIAGNGEGMKLSYEDLALLLGKEKSTIRGQLNAIKQKSEGLIEEIVEKNGKKRVFLPEHVYAKYAKYAKVRVNREGK